MARHLAQKPPLHLVTFVGNIGKNPPLEVFGRRPLPIRLAPPALRFDGAPLDFCPGLVTRDLVAGDLVSGNIAFTGFYELTLSKAIFTEARSGGLLVDVGANMGHFSILRTGARESTRAVAFEPLAGVFETLVEAAYQANPL